MTTTTVHPTVELSDAESAALEYVLGYELEDAPADSRADRQRIRHMLNLMDGAEQRAAQTRDVIPFADRFATMAREARETVEHDKRSIEVLTATGDISGLWPERSLEENFDTLRSNLRGSEESLAMHESLVRLAQRCGAGR